MSSFTNLLSRLTILDEAINSSVDDTYSVLANTSQLQAVVDRVLDLFTDEVLDSPEGTYDNLAILKAINNVRQYIETHVATLDQLKAFIRKILNLEGHGEIALHLSSALRVIKKQQDLNKIEDEETDPESYYDPSGRAGVGEEEYDSVMSSKEEEAEDDYDDDYGQELHDERKAREEWRHKEPVNPWEAEPEINYDFTDDFDGAFEFMYDRVVNGELNEQQSIEYIHHLINRDLTQEEEAQVYALFDGPSIDKEDSMMMGESYTATYMSEQVVYSTPKPITESVSFKQKFAPKTSFQLEELRRYGL